MGKKVPTLSYEGRTTTIIFNSSELQINYMMREDEYHVQYIVTW